VSRNGWRALRVRRSWARVREELREERLDSKSPVLPKELWTEAEDQTY
jgi:hypothetical protein